MSVKKDRHEVAPGVWVYPLSAVAKHFEAAKAMLKLETEKLSHQKENIDVSNAINPLPEQKL